MKRSRQQNIVTMVGERKESLRYTTAQRNLESGLLRYRWSLLKEKKARGVEAVEMELSKLSHNQVQSARIAVQATVQLNYCKTNPSHVILTDYTFLQ